MTRVSNTATKSSSRVHNSQVRDTNTEQRRVQTRVQARETLLAYDLLDCLHEGLWNAREENNTCGLQSLLPARGAGNITVKGKGPSRGSSRQRTVEGRLLVSTAARVETDRSGYVAVMAVQSRVQIAVSPKRASLSSPCQRPSAAMVLTDHATRTTGAGVDEGVGSHGLLEDSRCPGGGEGDVN